MFSSKLDNNILVYTSKIIFVYVGTGSDGKLPEHDAYVKDALLLLEKL